MSPRVYMLQEKLPPAPTFEGMSAAGEPLPSMLLGYFRRYNLIVVCCEPGYCPQVFIQELCRLAEAGGARTFPFDFSSSSSQNATELMARLSRSVRSKTKGLTCDVMVIASLLPPSDEMEVDRQTRAISKLVNDGDKVLITLRPEARQLLDSLPAHLLLTCDDISDVSPITRSSKREDERLSRFSRGIPALAQSLRRASVGCGKDPVDSTDYARALSELVNASLRSDLIDEELALRLTLVLLGRGTFEDVRKVLGAVDEETLEQLALWAPFFGISFDSRSFECPCSKSMGWFSYDHGRVSDLTSQFPDVAARCLWLLGSQGHYERLATLLPCLPRKEASEVIADWAPELIDRGFISMVSNYVNTAPSKTRKEPQFRLIEQTVAALGTLRGGRISVDDAQAPADEASMLCRGLIALRLRMRGDHEPPMILGTERSPLQKRVLLHEESLSLLLSGRFSDAMEALLPVVGEGVPKTVTEWLLRLDMEVARAFSCGSRWGDLSVVGECETFFSERGYEGLTCYIWAAELALGALGDMTTGLASAIRSKAAKSGDLLVRTLSLVCEGMMLLRRRPSAYVLAAINSAAEACAEISWEYAEEVARIFAQVARFQLGEKQSLYRVERRGVLYIVARLVQEACSDVADDRVPLSAAAPSLPPDATWLLVALTDDTGEFGEALDDQIPAGWRRMVEVARRNCVPQVKEKGLLTGAAKGALSARRSEFRVNVLGEFSLWVNGKRVSNADLAKRGARAILEYLALQSGHLSCRSRMASCIWPDVTDGEKALQRVYSGTSAIRSAIAAYGFTEDPFVSVKTSQVISLAPGVVTCDVDEFTMWAKHAVESTGDSRTCSAAMKAEELYAGDLCRLPEAPMMCLEDVREDLRRTYADAMVAGGEAAMRLDKKRLASRFANNALLVDDMREDAMTLLIRSLRASGRGVEAQTRYRSYERRLRVDIGAEPSRLMKRALHEPVGEMGGVGSEAAREAAV